MKTQGKKSIFTAPAAVEEAVTFFADLYAMGFIEPEPFAWKIWELILIPHDVNKASLVLILLSRGLSLEGRRMTKAQYVEILKGVNATFASKRSEDDIFSDFEVRETVSDL